MANVGFSPVLPKEVINIINMRLTEIDIQKKSSGYKNIHKELRDMFETNYIWSPKDGSLNNYKDILNSIRVRKCVKRRRTRGFIRTSSGEFVCISPRYMIPEKYYYSR
tara:strand:+ start:47 stop:370 length:324 start_codon:yes stop_codon:yes gene_type:complete